MAGKEDDEKVYRRRQERRFPQHSCELPLHEDRVYPTLAPTASRWERARRVLLRQIVGWRSSKLLRALRRSTYTIEVEQARQARSRYWWVLHPYSRVVAIWQMIVMISVLGFTCLLPFKYIFLDPYFYLGPVADEDVPDHPFLNPNHPPTREFMDRTNELKASLSHLFNFFDAVFVMHILMLFITGYHDPVENDVVLAPSRIIKRYLTTWFIVDLISTLKYSAAQKNITSQLYGLPFSSAHMELYFWEIVYILKGIRLHYLFLYASNWCYMAGVDRLVRRGILLTLAFFSFVLWMTYLSYQVPMMIWGVQLFREGCASWLMDAEIGYFDVNQPNLVVRQFLLCFYRVIAVASSHIPTVTVQTPHQTFEDTALLLIMMWVFTVFKIVLFYLMLECAEKSSNTEVQLEQIRGQVRNYMRDHNLPIHIRNKMMVFYNHKFEGRYFKERAIIAHMPPAIRNAVFLAIGRKLVTSTVLFRGVSKALVNNIVRELREDLFMPHDVVYCSGSPARHLYFLCTGTVALYLPTGEELAHLADGATFGEMGLLVREYHKRNVVSIVALEVCHVFVLEHTALERLVRPFPRLVNRMRSLAMQRAAEVDWEREDLFAFARSRFDSPSESAASSLPAERVAREARSKRKRSEVVST